MLLSLAEFGSQIWAELSEMRAVFIKQANSSDSAGRKEAGRNWSWVRMMASFKLGFCAAAALQKWKAFVHFFCEMEMLPFQHFIWVCSTMMMTTLNKFLLLAVNLSLNSAPPNQRNRDWMNRRRAPETHLLLRFARRASGEFSGRWARCLGGGKSANGKLVKRQSSFNQSGVSASDVGINISLIIFSLEMRDWEIEQFSLSLKVETIKLHWFFPSLLPDCFCWQKLNPRINQHYCRRKDILLVITSSSYNKWETFCHWSAVKQ